MILTVELSMYPFQKNYRELIKSFVDKLNGCEGIRVTTGPTSTVMVGEYERMMATLTEMMRWSHAEHGRAVFVAKLIPDTDIGTHP